ncbi:Uma2 family endonuclease [Actinomadura fibrosa]|uniref:Uma2 family endonuclease n=1 Tax=Actinomadura fibrosa TaxID=111802 RepID=A0ABW2Y2R4_9ACTN|nr:Uma2 family endonuclease [Actinomadura fibrosa]
MAALPDDHWLLGVRPQPVTAEEYDALPEEICRMIEVVDGQVVFCAAPTREHQRAVRRLAELLERHARSAAQHGHGWFEVDFDLDLRLQDVPLVNRRPDVALYRCPERGQRLRADQAFLVVEVVSPGSETSDTADKLAEYARAAIPSYWIVRLDGTGVSQVERYQLDRAARLYKHVNTLMREEGGLPEVGSPIPIVIDWAELEY